MSEYTRRPYFCVVFIYSRSRLSVSIVMSEMKGVVLQMKQEGRIDSFFPIVHRGIATNVNARKEPTVSLVHSHVILFGRLSNLSGEYRLTSSSITGAASVFRRLDRSVDHRHSTVPQNRLRPDRIPEISTAAQATNAQRLPQDTEPPRRNR